MKNILNLDKLILNLIPIIALINLTFLNEKSFYYSGILLLAILIYEFIVYDKKEVFGFSGLAFLSFPSILLTTFTCFIAIPSVYICYLYNYSLNTNPYFISIVFFYLFFPLGLQFGSKIKNIDIYKLLKMKSEKFNFSNPLKLNYEILLLIFSFCLLIVGNYLLQVNEIPLFELIKNPGEFTKLALLREQALKTLGLSSIEKYLFIWVRSLFIPFGIVGSLFLADNLNKRKYWLLFYLFFTMGLFINSITLEKSPIATIFLILTIYFYMKKNAFQFKNIILYLFIILSFPFLISYFLHFGKEGAGWIVLNSLVYRIFIIPSEVLFQYFNIFPDIHGFLNGRSTQIFSWMHPEGTFPLANYVARIWWNDPTTSGYCNANYIGNFWADFGYLGVFISTFIIGIISHLFYWKLLIVTQFKKNFIFVTSTAIVIPIFTFGFFSSNFPTLFITRGLLILFFYFKFVDFINIKKNIA